MANKQMTPLTWRRLVLSITLITLAALLRLWPLQALGAALVWVTFYPAVMVASIYGGLWAGLLATFMACIVALYGGDMLVNQAFISKPADWLGMIVFVFTGSMISSLSEAMLRANRRAKEAQNQAQLASQAKSAFLANMSHELRTPLNAILGYSHLMQKDSALTTENIDYLIIINRSGEHLLALLNEVLEISKIEAARVALDNTLIDFHELMHDLQKMFDVKATSKNLKFEITGFENVARYIIADETKLRIICINLIGNALKFTEKGSVSVLLKLEKEVNSKAILSIEVSDTGSGIADDEKDKLFQYFVQTESGKQSKSGTGLGLVISREYARLMQGDITVKSKWGVGSTFKVQLQIELSDESTHTATAKPKQVVGIQPTAEIPRILVAEDHPDNRKLLVKLMKLIGLDVREAKNGLEALKIAESWQPHFIWMDIRMPIMDGLEATRRIKAVNNNIKIVALSAHVLGNERTEIDNAGCDDFMAKPFKENELYSCMTKHLGIKYSYAEKRPETKTDTKSITSEMNLEMHDDAFIAQLTKAVQHANPHKILQLANEIKHKDTQLSTSLITCAQNYDYETIRIALAKKHQSIEQI